MPVLFTHFQISTIVLSVESNYFFNLKTDPTKVYTEVTILISTMNGPSIWFLDFDHHVADHLQALQIISRSVVSLFFVCSLQYSSLTPAAD